MIETHVAAGSIGVEWRRVAEHALPFVAFSVFSCRYWFVGASDGASERKGDQSTPDDNDGEEEAEDCAYGNKNCTIWQV